MSEKRPEEMICGEIPGGDPQRKSYLVYVCLVRPLAKRVTVVDVGELLKLVLR